MLTASLPPAGDRAVLAVIPAYNEEQRIALVVSGLQRLGLPVLVVDDGSRDRTAAVANDIGAMVLRRRNGGKGTAIIAGCQWAVENNYHRVLLIDGDGQHDPAEAHLLIAAALRGADLVIGKRMLDLERQPLHRRCLNRLSSLLVTLAAGRSIRDSQSGYRMCDPRLLLSLPLAGHKYDLETEMCILAARAGRRVVEVPIRVIYNEKVSGVHPLFDTLRFFRAVAMSLSRCRCGRRLAASPPFVLTRSLPVAPSRALPQPASLQSDTPLFELAAG
jgi:glycosyltransferase involved in cell wall biosynthesis